MRGDRHTPSAPLAPMTTILLGVAALLFLVLIWRFVSGGSAPDLATAPVSLRMTDAASSAVLTGENNKEKTLQTNTPLVPLDLIEMKNGTAKLVLLSNEKNTLNLNTGTKIRYLGQSTDNKTQFRLEIKDLWMVADTPDFTVDLLGVLATPGANSVANIAKNDLFTTLTVLQGSIMVQVGDQSVEIPAGQQLNYSTLRAVTIDDVKSRITTISPDTLTSPWMSLNGASGYTFGAPAPTTSPTGSSVSVGAGMIAFESPLDESTVDGRSIAVTGKILNPVVSRVIISNLAATVDPVKQTFSLASVPLTSYENNLIYRTYDVTGALLSKGFITVYTTAISATSGATPVSNTASTTAPTAPKIQNQAYKPDSRFQIVAPASDYFETRETRVKLEGSVAANTAQSVVINGLKLSSFAPNGTKWHYFANQQFGNMQDGTNTYTIQYLDQQGNEIYQQLFVIKKLPTN